MIVGPGILIGRQGFWALLIGCVTSQRKIQNLTDCRYVNIATGISERFEPHVVMGTARA